MYWHDYVRYCYINYDNNKSILPPNVRECFIVKIVFDPINNENFVSKQPTDYGHPVYSSENKNNNSDKTIRSIKVDDLVKKLNLNPNFIKIDVEGAEYEVLQGAKDTLKKYKAIIMLEKHPTLISKNISFDIIDNFLNEVGYKKEQIVFQDDIAINEIWKKKWLDAGLVNEPNAPYTSISPYRLLLAFTLFFYS